MIAGMASSGCVGASGGEAAPGRKKYCHHGNDIAAVTEEQVFPLLSLPEPALCKVISCLSFRDIQALKKTCVRLNCLINDRRLECRPWFARYSARQQADFRTIASNVDDDILQAWVAQLTKEKNVALRLMQSRKACSDFATFPEMLFFAITALMAKAHAFKCTTLVRECYHFCCEVSKFSVNGRFIMVAYHFTYTGRDDSAIDIFDAGPNGRWYRQVSLPYNGCSYAAAFSRDSNYLVLGGPSDCDFILYRQDFADGWRQCARVDHAGEVDLAVFSPDSRHLATTGSSAPTLKVLSLSGDEQWLERVSNACAHSIDAIFFSDNSRQMLVVSNEQGQIYGLNDRGLWTVEDNIHCGPFRHGVSPFSADGSWMVINNFGEEFRDCSATIYGRGVGGSWSESMVIQHDKPVFMVVISPSGRYLASSGHDGKVKTYICRQRWLQRNTIDHFGHGACVAFSPDERHLLSYDPHCLRISGLDQQGDWVGQAIVRFYLQQKIESAVFSSDSKHVLIEGNDYSVTIVSQGAENNWADRVTIDHVQSAIFSASGVHLLVVCLERRDEVRLEPDGTFETHFPACVKIYGPIGNRAWQEKAVIELYKGLGADGQVSARFSPDDRYVLICTSLNFHVLSIDNLPRTITLPGL